jgi:hypothetical protein
VPAVTPSTVTKLADAPALLAGTMIVVEGSLIDEVKRKDRLRAALFQANWSTTASCRAWVKLSQRLVVQIGIPFD